MLASATLRAEGFFLKPICLLLTTGTNGAAVQITTDGTICCNSVVVVPYTGAGICYLGVSTMDRSTGVGLIGILPTPGDSFALPQSQNGLNQLHLSDYYVAGTATGDKLLVSYWVA